MNLQIKLLLFLFIFTGISRNVSSQRIPGKFTPVGDKTMLIIGQDLTSVAGYVNSGKFPTPAGVTMYTDLYSMAGLNDITNYGAGDIGLQESMNKYPNSALSIGFWMREESDGQGEDHPNGLTELVNGQHNDKLDKFAAFAKKNTPRPIYLRIGYEFDGPWNNYDPGRYKAGYRYIVDYLNGKDVTNVAYVWQSATWGSNAPNIIDNYYPGDKYVDYVGLSFFFYSEEYNADNLDYILQYSRNKKKPIMVAEASAQYYEFDQGTYHYEGITSLGSQKIWDQYFEKQLIPFIDNNSDVIRALAWINADWQSQPLWSNSGTHWGDTRIEADQLISKNWNTYINSGKFLHGGPNLLKDLGINKASTSTPTCEDNIQNGDETGVDCGGGICEPCSTANSSLEENCGEYGLANTQNNTATLYVKDNGYRANYIYLCLNGDCRSGILENGYYKVQVSSNIGTSYNVEFKIDDVNGEVNIKGTVVSKANSCSFVGGNVATPTCDDSIQNGDETGVDCGGTCKPCQTTTTPTCDDSIKNGDETGVDCGGTCQPCNTSKLNAKLLPANDKILLTIGQDLKTITDYKNSGKGYPTMGGVTQYVALYSLTSSQNPSYGALGEDTSGNPTGIDINWGAGPLNALSGAIGFPESTLSLGMSIAEGNEFETWCSGCLTQLGNGGQDDKIKRFAKFAKDHNNTAIFLRLGFEFDGAWNRYEAETFKNAWRNFVNVMRAEGVTNVAYVWQASASPVDDLIDGGKENIEAYWPGDDYVDWLGYSWFLSPDKKFGNAATQRELADEVISLARRKNKPVKLCESAPQGYDISALTKCNIAKLLDGDPKTGCATKTANQIWNEWYAPFFKYIYDNKDIIRGVDYINVNWDEDTSKFGSGSGYGEGYWGDSRVQSNNIISDKWKGEIQKSIWLHGSSNLNSQLLQSESNNLIAANFAPESGIQIYPNPANGILKVKGKNLTRILINDLVGRVIKDVTVNPIDENLTISVIGIPKGIYLITTITTNNIKTVERLIIN